MAEVARMCEIHGSLITLDEFIVYYKKQSVNTFFIPSQKRRMYTQSSFLTFISVQTLFFLQHFPYRRLQQLHVDRLRDMGIHTGI